MTGDKFGFATTGTVQLKWYGNNINGEAYDVFGEYDLDPNLKYYFTASGEGTFTAERVYEEGIDRAHAIEITKDTKKSVTVGTSGGITDNTRRVKFTSATNGYLTLASEQSLSYTLYNADGAQIGTNDTAIYPIEVTEGTVYYVKVLYKGEYDENFKTATFELLLRDVQNANLGQVDPGESADDPYEFAEVLEADETHANLSSGTVEYNYGSMDNSNRYLKFTATADGEYTFTVTDDNLYLVPVKKQTELPRLQYY